MELRDISLDDRYDLTKSPVLLNGTQALVRLMLMQKARDKAAGLNTAGLVTGYRGSPLSSVDTHMKRAAPQLTAADVTFQDGLNEDLAATALWGAQQAELRGEGKFDGVFGLWYGKGPGVDRTGDVMRHANMAGTSANGGVLMAMGDDHTGESSTTLHQSDFAAVDAMIPVLSPAGVQEILDYGLFAYALSRYAGVWAGLKCMKDTIEVTSVVNADPHRLTFVEPDFAKPEGGLGIRLVDKPVDQEARLHDYKRFAAEAFGRANKIDKRMHGKLDAKIGIVAAGKNWLDLVHSLSLLDLDEAECERLGITTYKVGMVWPLDMLSFHDWAEGLDLIIVVEEKRKLLEVQIKEAIFDDRKGRRVYGWKDGDGNEMFPTRFALEPVMIAQNLGKVFEQEGCVTDRLGAARASIDETTKTENAPEIASRLAYFCSGCPHNSSTKIPEGSRAYAGIGCHYMVQWMDRDTLGYTHMGGEGANWIGEAPFSTREHVFQNIGDGTYNHSGIQAIRAAIATDTSMTYKILYNDAVAMTGGQTNDGGLDLYRIAAEVQAMGVEELAVVHDEKEYVDPAKLPAGISISPRSDLLDVEVRLSKINGVTALLYVQTCAAEKRRRRRRGLFPDPDKRMLINTSVCEGCGDCGVQSNCVSILPAETEFGRKRAIDQSSCNKDFTCLDGFCPSFVSLEGVTPKKSATREITMPDLPQPDLPGIDYTYNVVITGVGGTGVVTIGALLAMAANLDGKGAGMMEMAGLAQKGGAVLIHCRIAEKPEDINAIRVAIAEADAVIGGDLVTTVGTKTLSLMKKGRTKAVVNDFDAVTGDFTRDTNFRLPGERLSLSLTAKLGDAAVQFADFTQLARALMGDSIYSNMMCLGAAWQRGLLPLSQASIVRAIELNGTAIERNKQAFEYGRWAAEHPKNAKAIVHAPEDDVLSFEQRLAQRVQNLTSFQNAALGAKFENAVTKVDDDKLREAVMVSYHQLLAYKDEYEVARLHVENLQQQIADNFDGNAKVTFYFAPPFLAKKGSNGQPVKRAFGQWVGPVLKMLAKLKGLRGTPFDVFGYSADRCLERELIAQFESDMVELELQMTPANRHIVLELLQVPQTIRGYGHVKQRNANAAAKRRAELWLQMKTPKDVPAIAAE
jgi:indolepyruvate ferredoxin oxidoreductase